jgi:hypothetical protein
MRTGTLTPYPDDPKRAGQKFDPAATGDVLDELRAERT